MTQSEPDSLHKGGLTADLLLNLKARLDHVVGQVLEMSAMGEQQSALLARLAEPVAVMVRRQSVAAATQDEAGSALSELHLLMQLIIRQTEAIKGVVRLSNLVAMKLQAPLESLKRGSHQADLAPVIQPIAVAGDQEMAVVSFSAPENLVVLARSATATIEDTCQMLEIIETQVTALAASQELATTLLKSRMASVGIR